MKGTDVLIIIGSVLMAFVIYNSILFIQTIWVLMDIGFMAPPLDLVVTALWEMSRIQIIISLIFLGLGFGIEHRRQKIKSKNQ